MAKLTPEQISKQLSTLTRQVFIKKLVEDSKKEDGSLRNAMRHFRRNQSLKQTSAIPAEQYHKEKIMNELTSEQECELEQYEEFIKEQLMLTEYNPWTAEHFREAVSEMSDVYAGIVARDMYVSKILPRHTAYRNAAYDLFITLIEDYWSDLADKEVAARSLDKANEIMHQK